MNVKTQMYRTRHLVDILPTRPLGTHCRQFNFAQGNREISSNSQHANVVLRADKSAGAFYRQSIRVASPGYNGYARNANAPTIHR